MNYNLGRKANVEARDGMTRANYGRGSAVPLDMMAAKYDETDLYLDDNAYHNFSREILADRSVDRVIADEDQGPPSRQLGANVMRVRRNEVEVAMPELSYQELGSRPEDNGFDSAAARLADSSRFRNRYQAFRGEGPANIPTGMMHTREIRAAHDEANRRFSTQTQNNYGIGTEVAPNRISVARDVSTVQGATEMDTTNGATLLSEAQIGEDSARPGRVGRPSGQLQRKFGNSSATMDMVSEDLTKVTPLRRQARTPGSGVRRDTSEWVGEESSVAHHRSAATITYRAATGRAATNEIEIGPIAELKSRLLHMVAPQLARHQSDMAEQEWMADPTAERVSSRATGRAGAPLHDGSRLETVHDIVASGVEGGVGRVQSMAARANSSLLSRENMRGAKEEGEFLPGGVVSRVVKSGLMPRAIMPRHNTAADEYDLEDFSVPVLVRRSGNMPGKKLRGESRDDEWARPEHHSARVAKWGTVNESHHLARARDGFDPATLTDAATSGRDRAQRHAVRTNLATRVGHSREDARETIHSV